MKCPPSSIFVDMHVTSNRGHAIFISRQPLIILQLKDNGNENLYGYFNPTWRPNYENIIISFSNILVYE
jgi:hypothetical protein